MKDALLKAPGSLLSLSMVRGLKAPFDINDPRIQSAIEYIENAEPAIEGQNGSRPTFAAACRLVIDFRLPRDVALWILEVYYNQRCIPQWPPDQLAHKVDDAIKKISHPTTQKSSLKPLPADQIQKNIAKITGPELMTESDIIGKFGASIPDANSPSSFFDQAKLLIQKLFKPEEYIGIVLRARRVGTKCVPANSGKVKTREEWLRHFRSNYYTSCKDGAWIRINPLKHPQGKCDNDVSIFRYTLVEFDHIPAQQQLNLLVKIDLPIDAITWSGGRSYHAWVRVDATGGLDDYRNHVSRLHQSLRHFGVDSNTRNPSRMSRLPGVKRGKELQRIIYMKDNIIL